jgi:2-C-methyl-D-erythritol 4-phosphate cytidylyltransferase/2-C-methyl-D-erythritol 2,4-cyclodiphosphate synthase
VHRIAAIIVAAGQGQRAGGTVPKQFRPLAGIPVIARAVDALARFPTFIVIAAGQDAALMAALDGRHVAGVVTGGAQRQDSVRVGLRAVRDAGGFTDVLVHDAARPDVPTAVLDRLLTALQTNVGVVPVLSVADTLARDDTALGDTIDRTGLVRVQTPQAFALDAIIAAHERWRGDPATDDAQMVRATGAVIAVVAGDARLDKITHPDDFAAAQARLAARRVSRTAFGYDVHRLVAGERLWLGGIELAHDKGLSGHSDADVVLHALTDALLGTIGAGDIGQHFPPSDPQWRGTASSAFVRHALALLDAERARVEHVDLTIVCEAPKISPHRDVMRASIAALLRLPIAAVSVKATTTEGLGFTGRGEGIAAHAVASVSMEG